MNMSHLRKEFLTGVERIDSQHEVLFALIHEFQDAWRSSNSRKEALCCLEEMHLYVKFHFFSEEHLMQLVDYPRIDDLRKEHLEMIVNISAFIEDFKNGNAKPAEIEGFLFDWFLDHISTEDFAFAEFFRVKQHGSTCSSSYP
jgi:hemerythrin